MGSAGGYTDHVVPSGGLAGQHGVEKRGSGHPISETKLR